jgi:hypothetical protein
MSFPAIMSRNLGKCDGTSVVITFGMSDLSERLSVALVLLGVMLIMILFGHTWLPLSANDAMPSHEMSRPALPDWPHHDGVEYRG